MRRRNYLIILLAIALALPGCGQKRQSQSKLTIAAKKSASDNSAQNSQTDQTGQGTDSYAQLHESLQSRLAALGLPTPTRPEVKNDYEEKPSHFESRENVANSKLPRVDISLPDNYQLNKLEYTAGTISITNAGENNLPAVSGNVRTRGNSTVAAAKKALRIKFDSKQSLFGRSPEKSWTLLANSFDVTGIHNYVSYNLYDKLTPDGTFASLCEFVDVYINGAYVGVYNLCDQVETGKDRVPLHANIGATPEQTDYLIEQDFRVVGELPSEEGLEWFWLTWTNDAFKVKSPENKDGLTKDHTSYIKTYMDDVYAAIRLKDWSAINDLIDVNSFIIGQTLFEITKNYDMVQASVYLYKQANGKLTFGPAWDFDLSFGSCTVEEKGSPKGFATENSVIFGGLMAVPEYKTKYVTYFNEHLNEMLYYINSTIDSVDSTYGENLEKDFQNWGINYLRIGMEAMKNLKTHAEQTAFMKKWLAERAAWLHEAYSK